MKGTGHYDQCHPHHLAVIIVTGDSGLVIHSTVTYQYDEKQAWNMFLCRDTTHYIRRPGRHTDYYGVTTAAAPPPPPHSPSRGNIYHTVRTVQVTKYNSISHRVSLAELDQLHNDRPLLSPLLDWSGLVCVWTVSSLTCED